MKRNIFFSILIICILVQSFVSCTDKLTKKRSSKRKKKQMKIDIDEILGDRQNFTQDKKNIILV